MIKKQKVRDVIAPLRKRAIEYGLCDLADVSGISRTTLQRIFVYRSNPTLETMLTLAAALGLQCAFYQGRIRKRRKSK